MKLQLFLLGVPLTLASPLATSWDYIVVGSGASGIPLATRLSASGNSVLLVERGFATSGRWGGKWKPSWLQGTNLTRFDVPGLAQLVWDPNFDNTGVFCADAPKPAACMLGGGPSINAGQLYLPRSDDFDQNQPEGFRSKDMASARQKLNQMLPWTETPSMDGKSYRTNSSRIAVDALTNSSIPGHFRLITANKEQDRNRVMSYPEFFFQNGEKGGPMATYLVNASQRKNFKLLMNTTVTRVVRKGNTATGVEVESTGSDGVSGTIKLTPGTGRVILAAGVFNTFKILVRSGIGPVEEVQRLANQSSEAKKLPPKKEWLDLPVGHNLDDGPNLYFGIRVPDIEYYPWETLWSSTAENPDIKRYLEHRSGPLAEYQPTIGAEIWDTVLGKDGRKRVVQWDSTHGRNPLLPGDGGFMAFGSTLTLGHTSRGRLSINPSTLSVEIAKSPYFNDEGDHDFAAVVSSADSLLSIIKSTILQSYPGSFVIYPPEGVTMEQFFRSQEAASSNHWLGTAKMGKTCKEAGAVVDTTTVVCGMKNLHVADASIFNGLPTANPQATFITMAERAAEIIAGLKRNY